MPRPPKVQQVICPIGPSIAYLVLTQSLFALIDLEDVVRCKYRPWYFNGGYARSGKDLLHRFLLEAPDGTFVDHRNGNTLDYRKSNLRPATCTQNQFNKKRAKNNTSGYKGVNFHQNKWRAYIKINRKRIHLGHFDTPEEAHLAYCKAALSLAGEFAKFE